jgi:hypothetical protein
MNGFERAEAAQVCEPIVAQLQRAADEPQRLEPVGARELIVVEREAAVRELERAEIERHERVVGQIHVARRRERAHLDPLDERIDADFEIVAPHATSVSASATSRGKLQTIRIHKWRSRRIPVQETVPLRGAAQVTSE